MSDRFVRQADLVPAARLADLTATVIGVGAIGRQAALQLAQIGVRRLQLIDFDTVDETNITTQGYLRLDLGVAKVHATRRAIRALDPDIEVEAVNDRCRPTCRLGEAVFCCVDSISARAVIWRSAGTQRRFWCDGRMLGEVIRVLTVANGEGASHYATTLFAQSEAEPGRCTGRSTAYAAGVAAGLMLHQFARWLRDQRIDPDLSVNLLASELSVAV